MKVIYGTLLMLGNTYLCSGLKGDAFLDFLTVFKEGRGKSHL